MHPQLIQILEAHPDCYFQIFTNGQMITDHGGPSELKARRQRLAAHQHRGHVPIGQRRTARAGSTSSTSTLAGLENCRKHKPHHRRRPPASARPTSTTCVSETWLRRLIEHGRALRLVPYLSRRGPEAGRRIWPSRPIRSCAVRKFIVEMRSQAARSRSLMPYWDDKGEALCPMATGVSHHIGPTGGDIEPCPIIQFAKENGPYDERGIYDVMSEVRAFLDDFRKTVRPADHARLHRAGAARHRQAGLVAEARRQGHHVQRGTALAETGRARAPRPSQHLPGQRGNPRGAVDAYRFAKKHWFFGFGAYT